MGPPLLNGCPSCGCVSSRTAVLRPAGVAPRYSSAYLLPRCEHLSYDLLFLDCLIPVICVLVGATEGVLVNIADGAGPGVPGVVGTLSTTPPLLVRIQLR